MVITICTPCSQPCSFFVYVQLVLAHFFKLTFWRWAIKSFVCQLNKECPGYLYPGQSPLQLVCVGMAKLAVALAGLLVVVLTHDALLLYGLPFCWPTFAAAEPVVPRDENLARTLQWQEPRKVTGPLLLRAGRISSSMSLAHLHLKLDLLSMVDVSLAMMHLRHLLVGAADFNFRSDANQAKYEQLATLMGNRIEAAVNQSNLVTRGLMPDIDVPGNWTMASSVQEHVRLASPNRGTRSDDIHFREERQVFAAAAIASLVSTGISYLIEEFRSSGVNQALNHDKKTIITEVAHLAENQENLFRIANNTQEAVMKIAAAVAVAVRREVALEIENSITEMSLTASLGIDVLDRQSSYILALRSGKFDSRQTNPDELQRAIDRLREKALQAGLELPLSSIVDVHGAPTTTIVQDGILHVLVHLPLHRPSSDMELFRFVAMPSHLPESAVKNLDSSSEDVNVYSKIMPDHNLIATDDSRSQYLLLSDDNLAHCSRYQDVFFCPSVIKYNMARKSCLSLLLMQDLSEIKSHCHSYWFKMTEQCEHILNEQFLVSTNRNTTMTYSCNGRPSLNVFIGPGSFQVFVPGGCSLSSPYCFISRKHVELTEDMNIWIPRINNTVTAFDPSTREEKILRYIEAAHTLLKNTSKISANEIDSFLAFEEQLSGSSYVGAPSLTTLLIGFGVIIACYGLYILWQRRRVRPPSYYQGVAPITGPPIVLNVGQNPSGPQRYSNSPVESRDMDAAAAATTENRGFLDILRSPPPPAYPAIPRC